MNFAAQVPALQVALAKLRPDRWSYALGRFDLVRRAYGAARGLSDQLGPLRPAPTSGRPILAPFDVESAVAALRTQAFFRLPRLPVGVVEEIVHFAKVRPCRRQARPPIFFSEDVVDGRLPTGELAVLADVLNAEENAAVRAVANEPSVVRVLSDYLGYAPTRKNVRLIWSFVCNAEPAVREREGQTVSYHFDVHSYNFAYANYYLTDVDARSGAHTMIIGSHDDKPFRWLLGSAVRSDSAIRSHYGVHREITLEGPAGFGFIQDSSCYHRALAPSERRRLMLQIRYS